MTLKPFTLGVNYWPRRKAMYWWSYFDATEVQEEFGIIKDIGLNLVRIFLLWDDWQPTPERVNPETLNNLEAVCDIAASLDLKLDITFFTGHMSGANWAPGWMLRRDHPLPPLVHRVVSGGENVDCGYHNQYTDPVTIQAEELFLKAVVQRFHDHPAVGMWNIGNEPDLFVWPPDSPTGRLWVQRMTETIKTIDPNHPVTCGLHVASLIQENGLRVNDVFKEVDIPVMHGYPMYMDWSKAPLDPDFVPYLCALTSALCGKPTLMEEFGGCTEAPGKPSNVWKWTWYDQLRQQFMASEEDLANYIEQVLPKLVEVGATGAIVWCFADYVPELYDRPPCDQSIHERFFGLIRPDGSIKPHAEVFKRFAATNPIVQPAQRIIKLDISPETYYQDPLYHAKRLYKVFLGEN
jgi:endo-1,4-beta-mannosidase